MQPALFGWTLFVGAATLFLVQPLVGKLLLPLLGGPPGVWNTCMVFFQFLLLMGYLYAHYSIRFLGVVRQMVLHGVLLGGVVVFFIAAVALHGMPMPIVASLLPADHDYPIVELVLLLAIAVGGPFFILSTSSPVLQRWYAATDNVRAQDPYFLYAASNAGSLLGLLGYPFVLEPQLTLEQQQWVFMIAVGIYMFLAVLCAAATWRSLRPTTEAVPTGQTTPSPEHLPVRRVVRWVFLAALPSCLLLGVTTHVTTDLAAVPMLWVVPLALYLLSFIIVYSRWPDSWHRVVGRITPALILFVVITLLLQATEPFLLIALLHLGALFGVCLVCHGELARDRPAAEHLTAYYLWMSLGGMLGGCVVALIAPLLFHKLGMLEYPLALLAAAMVRPRATQPQPQQLLGIQDLLYVAVLLAVSISLVLSVPMYVTPLTYAESAMPEINRLLRGGLMFGIPAAGAFALVRRPARYAMALASLFIAATFDRSQAGRILHMERNFFGVVRVTLSPDEQFIRLIHGNTLHGQQRTDDPPDHPQPLTYYHRTGPMGRLFASFPPEHWRRVGVIGLGTGALAAYAHPGQQWIFYEIDPAVVRIARHYFNFLSSCRADHCQVVLGDARRQIQRTEDHYFDLLILDGFCSDAIPVHLLTYEAFELYMQKLAPRGVLAIHISNNHLDLPPMIARQAAMFHPPLAVRYCYDIASDDQRANGKSDSQWMILARSEAAFGPMARSPYWQRVDYAPGPIWRDNFANVWAVWKRYDEN